MSILKDASRIQYTTVSDRATVDEIKAGCLQRVADATELMAKDHARLQNERDMYERFYKEAEAKVEKRQLSINSLRGVITKKKAQIAVLKQLLADARANAQKGEA